MSDAINSGANDSIVNNVSTHWLYGIPNFTEGIDAHRHKVYWRGILVGFLNDPLNRQGDAIQIAAKCLLLESQNHRPCDVFVYRIWQEIDAAQSSNITKYLCLWTLKDGAPDPCRIFLMQAQADLTAGDDSDPGTSFASFYARIAEHVHAFRTENELMIPVATGNSLTFDDAASQHALCSQIIIQNRESVEYAYAQIEAALANTLLGLLAQGADSVTLKRIQAQAQAITTAFQHSVPITSLPSLDQLRELVLAPFVQVVTTQVQGYWSNLIASPTVNAEASQDKLVPEITNELTGI